MPRERVPSPWADFLKDVDEALSAPVDLHCLGGFVVSIYYGQRRATDNVDVASVAPRQRLDEVLRIAGRDSTLARKYRLHIDYVTVATIPESYEQRLRPVFEGRFRRLRLCAFDPYDLALAKLERNLDVDRDDVRFLGVTVPLDPGLLRERYLRELRPLLSNPAREDPTLDLWTEMIQEARQQGAPPAGPSLNATSSSRGRGKRSQGKPAVHASSRELGQTGLGAIDQQVRFAIAHKRLLRLGYAGRLRVVEPHDYGIHKRSTRLLVYQRREVGSVDQASVKGWRLLDVSKIESCSILEESFPGSRGASHQNHYTWDVLYARVT